MELWSVGRHVFVVIVTIGWQLWLVQSQQLPEPGSSIGQASAPKSPSAAVRAVAAAASAAADAAGLSGPAIGLQAAAAAAAADPGLPAAACGVPPASCVFNTTVPHYHNCRKYRVCGFTNNWQLRTCRRGENFDRTTLQCRPAGEARCAACPGPGVPGPGRPATKGPTTLGLAHRTTRPSTTKPPGFGSRPRRTTPWTPHLAGTVSPRPGSATDEACRTNFAAPCLNRSATIPDPANCSRYMECDNDQWISRLCAIGTYFDKVIKRCLYPKDATCQLPCPRVECNLGAQCMLGWHVGDPTDCGKYYTCGGPPAGGGSPWGHRQCPIDKPFFDAVTLGCVTKTANCTASCNTSALAPTLPSNVSNNSTTTTASTTQLTGKDITLKMPLAELCNSPYRTDHSSCSVSSNGFIHRHPTNCRKYFLCVGNRWMPGACPDLQFWSIRNASCVPQGSMVCVSFQCDPQSQNRTLTPIRTSSTSTSTVATSLSTTTVKNISTLKSTATTTATTTTVPTTIKTTTTSTPTAATSPTTAPTSTTPFITTANLTTLSTDATTTPRITTPTTPKATLSTTTTTATTTTTTTSSTPSMMTPNSTIGSTTNSTRTSGKVPTVLSTSSSTPTPSTRSSAKTSTQTTTVVTTTGTTSDSALSLSSGTTVTNTTAVKPTTASENNITHTVSTLQINNTLSTVSTISVESSSSMSVPSIPVTFEPTPSSPVASATSSSPTPMSATNMTSAAWLTSSTSQTSPSSPEVTSSATPANPSPSSTTTSNTSTSQVPTSISAPATSAPSKSSTTSTMSTVSATAVTSPHTSVVDSTSTVISMNAVTNTSGVERTSTAESITHTSAVSNATTPNVTTPNVTTPNVTTPNVTHPAITTPTVNMTVGTSPTETTPPVSTAPLTTPTVATPTVTTSSITTPTVTSPTVTSPILTSPTVTTSTVTTPTVTTPTMTTPIVISPTVTMGTVTTPPVTTPPVTTPLLTFPTVTTATVTTPPVTTPPVTSPPVTSPTVTSPTVTTPTVTTPTIASPTVTNVTNTLHHSSGPTSYPATSTPTSLLATKPANITNTASSTMSLATTAQPGSPQGNNGTTQSVDSQSTKHSTESTQRHLPTTTEVLPVRCLEEQVGLQVWPEIEQGTTVQGICPAPKTGLSVRRCVWEAGVGAMWQFPDYQLCVDPPYDRLLESVEALDHPPPTIDEEPKPPKHALRRTIMKLASLTKTSLAKPTGIRAGNLNASLQAIDSITQVVQKQQLNLTVDITLTLFNIVGHFLSPKNKRGWSAVREQDPSRGVTVLAVVDRIGRQMAQNSMSNTMTSRTMGLSIRAEMRHKEDIQTFDYTPDPPPGSRPDPTGIRDRVILDKKTLEAVKKELPGDMVAVWSTYYHTMNNILPVKGDDFLNSHVLSVSVQGLPNGQVLRPPVRLHFASLNHSVLDMETHCAFWEFSPMNRGRWSVDGCKIVRSDLSGTICECEHLTNFAILLSPSPASGIHTTILSVISVVGSLLSILGMLVTICLYILSWKRVKSHHAAVLMNLCIALIIANITFLAGIDRTENKLVCTVVAGMLHFFYLVAFCMMFADGIQFILYVVQVFHVRRKKDTFLLVLICWVIPAAIVATSLGITRGEGYGTEDYCWLRKDTGLIAAFAVPAIIIMIANFVILCKILHTISNSKGSERNNRVKATIWNIAVMMPLLGLTWVFGLFSVNDKTVYFQYIFCICNSLQGFFIFFFHCALNKKMRQAVIERFSSRSSQSSSMRKSGGSNKSDKKKGNGKLSKKADKSKSRKKPTISPPKLQGRKPEYIAPRHQVAAPNMYPPTSTHGNHQMAPPTGAPAQNPDTQYMDLEEAKMAVCIARVDASPPPQYPGPLRLSQYDPGEDPVHGPAYGPVYGAAHSPGSSYGPMHSPVNRSMDRPPRSGLPRQDQRVQQELDSFRSQERQNYEYDLALTCYLQDRDMDQIDLNFTSSERSIRRGQPDDVSWVPTYGADQPRPWWFGGPHTNQSFKHSMSMEDLRHLDDPCEAPRNNSTATTNNSPWMPVEQEDEDPYLIPLSHHLGVPPESAPDTDWLSATFDPHKESHQSPLRMARYHRLGSHSRSLDRLDRCTWLDRRALPKRQKGISASSMKRFTSKERGGAFIVMQPQHLYENVVQGGGSSDDIHEDPLYMHIDEVTMDVDSPASALDYTAAHA